MTNSNQPTQPTNITDDGAPGTGLGARVRQWATSVRWYTRELMGDATYDNYVRHQRINHPDAPVLTEKEFWKAHYAHQDANPNMRCC